MKRILLIFIICFMGLGCGNHNSNKKISQNKNYVKIELGSVVLNVPYIKPLDFKQYEVYISLTTSFNPTGYSGTEWTGEPNVTADWDGATNNLFMVSPTDPIQVVGLTSGTTYYVKVVAVDKSNQRSIPSIEYTTIAGDTQRSSTVVIAAPDASPKSVAGADYVCSGTSSQTTFNTAINAAITDNPNTVVTIKGTEGTYIIDGSIIIPSNVTLDIPGIIKVKDGMAADLKAIINSDTTGGNSNITIKNLTLDGNKDSVSSGTQDGIYFVKTSILNINKIIVKNFNRYGVILNVALDSTIITNSNFYNNSFIGCAISGTNSSNIKISKCTATGVFTSLYDNFGISASGENITIDDCLVKLAEVGINLSDGTNSIINSCRTFDCGYSGIFVMGGTSSCRVTNNIAYSNGQYNIIIADSNYVSVQNNNCRSNSSTLIGISIDSNCTGTIVDGNDCYTGGTTAGISDSGTNTKFGNNRNNDGTWSTTPN